MDPVNRVLWRNLIWLGLVAIFAMAAAWFGGDLFIVRPVKKLRAVTQRLAAGDLTVRAGPDYAGGELGLLAQAFDQMADSLQEREEALRESQRQAAFLADLLESSSQPFGVARLDGGLEFFNSAYPHMLGYSEEEFHNLDWARDLTPPDWLEREQTHLQELERTGQPVRYEKEYFHKDGSRVPVELLVHLRRLEQGSAALYFAFITDITERKRAEVALKESEERYRSLFENSNAVMFLVDPGTGAIVDANLAACSYYGYFREDLQARKITDLNTLSPEQVFAEMRRARERQQDHFYFQHRLASGEVRDVEVFSGVIQINGQDLLYSIVHDITARKQAEGALSESEERLRLLGDNLPESAVYQYVHEDDGRVRFLYMSAGIEQLNGVSVQDVLNDAGTLRRQVPPEYFERLVEAEAKSGRELSDFDMEVPMRRPDGQVRWMQLHSRPRRMAHGRIIWDGVQTDITERKRGEEALRESEGRFRGLFESMTEGVALHEIIYDDRHKPVDYRILAINPAFTVHTGLQPEQINGRLASAAYGTGEAPFLETYARVAQTGEPVSFETVFKPLQRCYYISASSPRSGQFVTVFEDITARKKMEEALRERTSQLEFANRELESFSYSVSHDLKAPIRAIAGFSRMLAGEHAARLDEEGLRLLKVITSNTKLMSALVDDLLALSRLGRREIRKGSINLTVLARQVFEQLKNQEPERDLQSILKDLPPALGDQALLHQVLENLLSNAIKYTKTRKTAVIEVGGREEENETIYYVKDNGIGFDMRYAGKLYGVFQRLHGGTEYEGTGVGLAIVKRIIERHGGRVWAEGKVNEGATFYFALPKDRV